MGQTYKGTDKRKCVRRTVDKSVALQQQQTYMIQYSIASQNTKRNTLQGFNFRDDSRGYRLNLWQVELTLFISEISVGLIRNAGINNSN